MEEFRKRPEKPEILLFKENPVACEVQKAEDEKSNDSTDESLVYNQK